MVQVDLSTIPYRLDLSTWIVTMKKVHLQSGCIFSLDSTPEAISFRLMFSGVSWDVRYTPLLPLVIFLATERLPGLVEVAYAR